MAVRAYALGGKKLVALHHPFHLFYVILVVTCSRQVRSEARRALLAKGEHTLHSGL